MTRESTIALLSLMNKDLTIVGISGFARTGKDTLCDLITKKNPRFRRYAFADKLKRDLHLFLMEQCKINILHLSENEKKLVRPLLISYGCMMRNMGDGLHWVRELEKQMLDDVLFQNNLGNTDIIPVITDFRFENEVIYFKSKYNLIMTEVVRNEAPEPPDEEKLNQPLVRKHVNYTIDWPTVGENNINILHDYAENFVKNYNLV